MQIEDARSRTAVPESEGAKPRTVQWWLSQGTSREIVNSRRMLVVSSEHVSP